MIRVLPGVQLKRERLQPLLQPGQEPVRIGKVLEAHHGVEVSTANSAVQAHQILSRQEIGTDVLSLLFLEDHLVETGRQHVDQVQGIDQLRVLLRGDLGGACRAGTTGTCGPGRHP
jgi:hypothetical protein